MLVKLSFKIKTIGGLVILSTLFLGVAALISLNISGNTYVSEIEKQLDLRTKSAVVDAEGVAKDAVSDLLALAASTSVHEIIHGQGGGLGQVDDSAYETNRKKLEDVFVAWSLNKGRYAQIEYIDKFGAEVVQVSFDGKNTSITPKGRLQNEAGRHYFQEAINSKTGQVYASDFHLNKEGSPPKVTVPSLPVVSYAVAVYDAIGDKSGVIVIDLFGQFIIDKLIVDQTDHNNYLIDPEGYYSINPDQSKTWGSPQDLNNGANFFVDYPNLKDRVSNEAFGLVAQSDDIFSFGRVSIDPGDTGNFLILIERSSRSQIFQEMNQVNRLILWIMAALLLLVYGCIYFYISWLLRPLQELSAAADRFGMGDLGRRIVTKGDDEISRVAQSFNRMADRLTESYRNLDLKVKRQTDKISEDQKDLEKRQTAILNILEDVEAERSRVSSLALDLEKFKLAVDNVSDQILITDANGIVLYANKIVEKTTGYSLAEVVGKKVGALWNFPMPESFYKNMWDIIKNQKKNFTGEIQNRRKGGEIYTAEISISPVLDNDGRVIYFVGIERDITKEREVSKAKSEFVSFASHQLRTPLTGIRWVAERLVLDKSLSAKNREYINDIENATGKLTKLVDTLLNLSRIESGGLSLAPESVELVAFIRSYLEECRPMLEKKRLTLISKDMPNRLKIETDLAAIRNIIQSIISNAMEYTPNGGRIEIVVKDRGEKFQIKISDNGIGIPKGEQSKIFEKFGRAENAKLVKINGIGLGMFVAKQATELLGGSITFESVEDKGTTFYLELPKKIMSREGEKHLS